jgi:hypothetical protein
MQPNQCCPDDCICRSPRGDCVCFALDAREGCTHTCPLPQQDPPLHLRGAWPVPASHPDAGQSPGPEAGQHDPGLPDVRARYWENKTHYNMIAQKNEADPEWTPGFTWDSSNPFGEPVFVFVVCACDENSICLLFLDHSGTAASNTPTQASSLSGNQEMIDPTALGTQSAGSFDTATMERQLANLNISEHN